MSIMKGIRIRTSMGTTIMQGIPTPMGFRSSTTTSISTSTMIRTLTQTVGVDIVILKLPPLSSSCAIHQFTL